MSDRLATPRLSAIGVICLALFVALLARLSYLQLGQEQSAEVAVRATHLRTLHTEGPRGRILDRNGKVLVDNRISIEVALDNKLLQDLKGSDPTSSRDLARMDKRRKMFNRLAILLSDYGYKLQGNKIEALFNDKRFGPQDLIPIIDDVPEELEHYLVERAEEFPGVVVVRRAVRSYPYGRVAAQILGYVGQINDAELATKEAEIGKPGEVDSANKPYEARDEIGKAGIERSMEQYLRAVPGDQEIEVDAQGKFLRALSSPKLTPGDDVWLTIDIDEQAYAEQQLQAWVFARNYTVECDGPRARCDAQEGAVSVVDPRNGELRALASYPSYDPRELVGGLSADVWDRLNDPASHTPMLNRAISGAYSPGSTFKPFTAHAALEKGYMTPDVVVDDSKGFWELEGCSGEKCRFYNDDKKPRGPVGLSTAITVSSDVFFYRIGDEMWRAKDTYGESPIQDSAKLFGLGRKLGIELPSESTALVGDPAWLSKQNPNNFDHVDWKVGDNVNAAIGQGLISVTPLQLSTAYGAIGNGGTVYTPRIVSKVTHSVDLSRPVTEESNLETVFASEPVVNSTATFSDPRAYNTVMSGLKGVVMSGSGTANAQYRRIAPGMPIAGKTGTIQVADDPKTGARRPPTSAFAAFGPATDDPNDLEMAISVFIPAGGYGADAAAPLAFEIMKTFHAKKAPVLDAAPVPGVSVSTTSTTTTTTTTTAPPTTLAPTTTVATSKKKTAVPSKTVTSTTAPKAKKP